MTSHFANLPGGGVTDMSQAFPQVHAFKGFPRKPDATHS